MTSAEAAISARTGRGDASPAPALWRGLIIIVHYRTPDLAIDCLESLSKQVGERWRVVVVDNASDDGSDERLESEIERRGWGGWARLERAGANAGFAAGNNVGLRLGLASDAPPDVFFLLNPDTIVPERGLDSVARAIGEHPGTGVFGVSMVGPDAGRMANAFRFPSILSEFEQGARFGPLSRALGGVRVAPEPPEEPVVADWMSGAALVVRRNVVESIGLMDEGFFLYFEEVDWLRRAAEAGVEARYVPGVDIVHLEGAATGCGARTATDRARARRPRWWYDARRRYFVKHHGWFGLLLADALWGLGRASLLTRRALRLGGSTDGDPARFARDLLAGDLRAAWSALARPRSSSANSECAS